MSRNDIFDLPANIYKGGDSIRLKCIKSLVAAFDQLKGMDQDGEITLYDPALNYAVHSKVKIEISRSSVPENALVPARYYERIVAGIDGAGGSPDDLPDAWREIFPDLAVVSGFNVLGLFDVPEDNPFVGRTIIAVKDHGALETNAPTSLLDVPDRLGGNTDDFIYDVLVQGFPSDNHLFYNDYRNPNQNSDSAYHLLEAMRKRIFELYEDESHPRKIFRIAPKYNFCQRIEARDATVDSEESRAGCYMRLGLKIYER